MKKYDETIKTVFDRIGNYQAKQKRKKEIILKAVTPFCCLCILGAISVTLWNREKTSNQNQYRMAGSVSSEKSDNSVQNETLPPIAQPEAPTSDNKIIIHSVESFSEGKMDICLMWDDFVPMTEAEINAYYGINVFPEIPQDLTAWDGHHGIYKCDGGTGEIYWDQNIQNYSNDDLSRELNVETAKGRLPFHCCIVFDPETENSIINGNIVDITLSEDGCYRVWFFYQDVGFYIFARGFTEGELISVIESLII